MSYLKESLALTSVELKTKSLFFWVNLFKKVDFCGSRRFSVRRKKYTKIIKERAGGIYEVDIFNPFGKARVNQLHRNEVQANKF
jgi:hypothetical protein